MNLEDKGQMIGTKIGYSPFINWKIIKINADSLTLFWNINWTKVIIIPIILYIIWVKKTFMNFLRYLTDH